MMVYKSIIFWYLLLMIFAIIGGTLLSLMDFLPSFIALIVVTCVYVSGWSSNGTNVESNKIHILKRHYTYEIQKSTFLYLGFFMPFVSYYVTFFYTGKNFFEVINLFLSGGSLYANYQSYFIENNISQLDFNKAPAIIGSIVMKYSVLLAIISALLSKKISLHQFFCTALIILSYLYFSIARGTSFEFFEILMLVWFCIILSNSMNKSKFSIFKKSNIILVTLSLTSLMIYNYNISARYSFVTDFGCPTDQLCINTNSFVYYFSESVAILFNKLSGYFTFGLYYISRFIVDVWFSTVQSFFSYFFPANMYFSDDINDKLCGVFLDCGVAWKPDFLKAIDSLGVIGLFILIFLLGRKSASLSQQIFSNIGSLNNSIYKILTLYFIFLFMISLPVGNFIFASSSNIVIIVFLLFKNQFHKYKI